jgi:hypothetical protein
LLYFGFRFELFFDHTNDRKLSCSTRFRAAPLRHIEDKGVLGEVSMPSVSCL